MAYHYTISELKLSGYKMTTKDAGDNPALKGASDDTLFRRTEANDVVLMINKLMQYYNFQNLSNAQKIESFIRINLPPVLRKQEEVYDWLIQVFHGYK